MRRDSRPCSSLLLCSTTGRMADFAGGAIQAFVGPTELAAADDLEAIIVGFIGEAQESLDIAVQEIDSEIIAQASRPDLETANPPAPMASCRPAPPRAA